MREPEEVIKPQGVGTTGQPGADRELVFAPRFAVHPVESEVPFAYAGGVVTVPTQEGCHRDPVFRNDGRRVGLEHAELSDPKWITAGQDAVAGRSAIGRRRMCVGEAHPFAGEPVETRHLERRVGPVAGWLSEPDVIKQNEHDVRFHRCGVQARNKRRNHGGDDCQPKAGFRVSLSHRFLSADYQRPRLVKERRFISSLPFKS